MAFRRRYRSRRPDRLPRRKRDDSPAVAYGVRAFHRFPLLFAAPRPFSPVEVLLVPSSTTLSIPSTPPPDPRASLPHVLAANPVCPRTHGVLAALHHPPKPRLSSDERAPVHFGWVGIRRDHSVEPSTNVLEDGQRSSVQLVEAEAVVNDVHQHPRFVSASSPNTTSSHLHCSRKVHPQKYYAVGGASRSQVERVVVWLPKTASLNGSQRFP